jgi:hypothetical protein
MTATSARPAPDSALFTVATLQAPAEPPKSWENVGSKEHLPISRGSSVATELKKLRAQRTRLRWRRACIGCPLKVEL